MVYALDDFRVGLIALTKKTKEYGGPNCFLSGRFPRDKCQTRYHSEYDHQQCS